MAKTGNVRSKKASSSKTPASSKKGAKEVSSADVAQANNGPSDGIDMNVDETNVGTVNGHPEMAEPEQTPAPKQTVKSQKKKAGESAAAESSQMPLDEKGDTKSNKPVSKTREKSKRGQTQPMELTKESENENEMTEAEPEIADSATAGPSDKGLKRAAEQPAEVEEQKSGDVEKKSTEVKSRKKKMPVDDTKSQSVAAAEEESVPEASASTSVRSRKRKADEPTTSKSASKKTSKEKSAVANVRTKTKQGKVLLSIPPLKSVSGKVFVIGENDVGQLGMGEDVEVRKRPALLELPHAVADIAAGGMHSVCLTQTGEVITFGCNDEGALGRITSNESEEGTPKKVDIPEKVVQISAGDSHTAALAESGQVYLWGNFRSGDGPIGLTADGSKQIKPIKILSGVTIVKISSGTEHLVCLSDEGVVYTCGCGENGQLGRVAERSSRDGGRKGLSALLDPAVVPVYKSGSKSTSILMDDIFAGSYTTFLKTRNSGLIYACGLNNYNHLGYEGERVRFFPIQVNSFNSNTWSQITGGQHHTVALDDNGLVYSLGRQDYGRLGLGENCDEKSIPTAIPTLENQKCVYISCGNCVSFAVVENGYVYSWGMGTNHQLGHGNEDDCHVPRLIEGNFHSSWRAEKVSGGGQHTLILARPKESAKSSE